MLVSNAPQRTTMETLSLPTFLCSAHSIYQTKWLQVMGLGSLWITTRFLNILDSLEPSRKKYSFGFHSSQLQLDLLWLCLPSPVYNLLMCFYRRNRNQFLVCHDLLFPIFQDSKQTIDVAFLAARGATPVTTTKRGFCQAFTRMSRFDWKIDVASQSLSQSNDRGNDRLLLHFSFQGTFPLLLK